MSTTCRPSFVRELQRPIVGKKLARLVSADERVRFAPQYPRRMSRPYDADADAVCENRHTHAAPSTNCRCGFHAVASDAELWRLGLVPEAVLLDVEISGTVIEHEFGWRAGHQSVLGVHLPARCTAKTRCRRPVAGIATDRAGAYATETSSWVRLRAVCARCADNELLSIADLAGSLGAEVTPDGADVMCAAAGRTPVRRCFGIGIGEAFATSASCLFMPPSALSMPRAESHEITDPSHF